MARTPADCHGLVAFYRPAPLPVPAQARLEAVQATPEPDVLGTIKPRGWRVSWPTYSRAGVTLRLVSLQTAADDGAGHDDQTAGEPMERADNAAAGRARL